MKILAFVDLHGSKKALSGIVERAKKKDIDAVVCAGDFTIFQHGIELILSKLNHIGKPVLFVHGNHEDDRDVRRLCTLFRNCYFIHNNKFRIGEYLFIGWGGGGFSFKDKELEEHFRKFKGMIKEGDKVVFVTHAPPYGTRVDRIMNEHAGNKTIRKFIERFKPILTVCGHLHECIGNDKIGKTFVINPGYKGKVISI
jgi:hypothetical protein